MADSAAKLNGVDCFKAPLGNDEISIEIDIEKSQLMIEVANLSRFVVHRRNISKPDEVKDITGTS